MGGGSHGFADNAGFAGSAVCEDGGWNLVDMGTVVIHLMTAQSREFYELEELWNSAGRVYPL
jgi:ribosomal silencing factor RsfS